MASEQVSESPEAAARRWQIAAEQYHAELTKVVAERDRLARELEETKVAWHAQYVHADQRRMAAEREVERLEAELYDEREIEESRAAEKREREEWQARCISRGKENDELHDEIARLRRAFPVDRLREYDRRRKEAA